MRKCNLILTASVLSTLLTSCANTYQFLQVYETNPIQKENLLKNENGELRYENSQCAIDYCFWSNGGSLDFDFYNKTDEIIYIDLAKSFFVMNGEAFDLYRGREWSQSTSVGIASTYSYIYGETNSAALSIGVIEPNPFSDGIIGARASKSASRSASIASGGAISQTSSNTVTVKEKQIIAVPPHSKKHVSTYQIKRSPWLSCKLQRYPSRSAKLNFTEEDSPFIFSDIISFNVGNNPQVTTIKNEFYVSTITNYAEPEFVVMKKKDEPCENMRGPNYAAPVHELYNKVIRDNICEPKSSFYNTYEITSGKKLYENKKSEKYYYDYKNKGYYKMSSGSKSGSGTANNKSTGIAAGVVGIAVLLGLVAFFSGVVK